MTLINGSISADRAATTRLLFSVMQLDLQLSGASSFVQKCRFAGKAFSTGTAWCIDGNRGGALWLPPGVKPDEDVISAILDESVPQDVMADVNTMFGEMAAYHPRNPHWYLPVIGTEPHFRRRGMGSALLRETLGRCDQEHMPAYLESSNPANAALYQRVGFEPLGVIRAGDSPPMVPMLRPAR
jgi:ribosomal protein S18 acetylase RimI-like enzyme